MISQNIFSGEQLNSDLNGSLQEAKDITFLLNGDFSSQSNDGYDFFVQNVASNSHCYTLNKEILGVIKLDYTEFVIFSEDEIGLFNSDNCTYVSLIVDSCLNFGQVKGVYRYTNHGRRVYFIDTNNPLRYYDVDKSYPRHQLTNCKDCKSVYTDRLDCDRLLVWKPAHYPTVTMAKNSGSLPSGMYQIALAFTDKTLRLTDYFIYPTIITISPYEHSDITLIFDCFNNLFLEYELILISHRADRGTVAQRIGYFNNKTSVSINQIDSPEYTPIDTRVLLSPKSYYQSFENIDFNSNSTDGQLVLAGLKERKPINYWHQVFNIKAYWQEIIVNGKDAAQYSSYMRDEVYRFSIAWLYKDGQISNTTVIPNTVPLKPEWDVVVDNADTWHGCNGNNRKYWDIYNTAAIIDRAVFADYQVADCGYKLGNKGSFGYWESGITYPDHANFKTDTADYRCTGIRGFKFPSNKISPHHTMIGTKEYVVPLTIQFDNIERPKDCDGNYIADITGYIIYGHDRKNHKSILHKGLISNMFEEDLIDCSKSYYANYPYNDLNKDVFLSKTLTSFDNRTSFAPVENYVKNKFLYISPDVDYVKNSSGSELYLYENMYGRVRGNYNETNEFPRIRYLSDGFYSTLGGIVETLELLQILFSASVFGIGGGGGIGVASPVILIQTAYNLLKDGLNFDNYGINYFSRANYSNSNFDTIVEGNTRRQITYSNYLLPIKQIQDNDKVNNYNRETGLYVKVNSDIANPAVVEYSRVRVSNAGCANFEDNYVYNPATKKAEIAQASCYYAGYKEYTPNQYGDLQNGILINKYFNTSLKDFNTSDIIIGGDIYITKHSKIRKFPFFKNLPEGGINETGFAQKNSFNIWKPRFWMDYQPENTLLKTLDSLPIVSFFTPDLHSGNHNFENINLSNDRNCSDTGACAVDADSQGLWDLLQTLDLSDPIQRIIYNILLQRLVGTQRGVGRSFRWDGSIYTHVVGVQEYWCESEFIADYRLVNEIAESNTKVHYTNLIKYSRITNSELFLYNLQYIWNGIPAPSVPSDPKVNCCCELETDKTRVIFSQNNNIEAQGDKWLSFLPNNYHQFVGGEGTFTGIHRIDDGNMLFAFENAMYITQSDAGLLSNQGTVYLGEGSIFKRRIKRLSDDETGLSGCIDSNAIINTRYGVFWVDKLRKRFFMYDGHLNDVTGTMKAWSNQFLSDIPNTLIAVFDNYTENLYISCTEVNNAWTISYKPMAKSWVSFHSFLPQSYIQTNNNYLTIQSVGTKEIVNRHHTTEIFSNNGSIWKHNAQYKYQNYYGVPYKFDVGYTINNKFKIHTLQSIEVFADFINEYGYGKKEYTHLFFDTFLAYTNKTSTGLRQIIDNELGVETEVMVTRTLNESLYRINNFIDYSDQQPIIEKTANGYNVLNTGIEGKGKIRGSVIHVHLISDKDIKILLKLNLGIQQENIK